MCESLITCLQSGQYQILGPCPAGRLAAVPRRYALSPGGSPNECKIDFLHSLFFGLPPPEMQVSPLHWQSRPLWFWHVTSIQLEIQNSLLASTSFHVYHSVFLLPTPHLRMANLRGPYFPQQGNYGSDYSKQLSSHIEMSSPPPKKQTS